MRILLAEDDSVLADGLTRSLRQSGYAIDDVRNGQDADTALSTQEFDLLILDLGLPKMSGLEVLRRLRARSSLLPVLILTAADSVEQRVEGLDLGADDYMAKPFALSELEARVRALTRRGQGGGQCLAFFGGVYCYFFVVHNFLSVLEVPRCGYPHAFQGHYCIKIQWFWQARFCPNVAEDSHCCAKSNTMRVEGISNR